MKDHEWWPLVPIREAEGAWLIDYNGKRYLDAVSSWWTQLLGHRHPSVVAALKDQLDRLDHVIFAGFTHEPAIRLAEKLTDIAPAGLSRVLYADSGSAAVEIALKMSFQYHVQCGRSRRRFVHLEGGYHGETLGALAVGDLGLYRDAFRPLLFDALCAPSPDAYRAAPGVDPQAHAAAALLALEQLFDAHRGQIAALIFEPLVQCAAGMRMHHPNYLSGLRRLCSAHGVHLIADEVAVGFGRTGTWFACHQGPIQPDFLCLSKGLSGGFLPLSAVLTSEATYAAFYDDYDRYRAFMHSHSYTGNPLACRAALAVCEHLLAEPVLARVQATSQLLATLLAPLRDRPQVSDVRVCGLIGAVEIAPDGNRQRSFAASERRGLRGYAHALERGVLLRPLGNVLYLMPPFCISDAELAFAVEVLAEAVDLATA